MDDNFTINVTVAERRYPIGIKRKDEETVRKAAKKINDMILLYRKKKYKGVDSQDFIAMAALQLVIKYIELVDKNDIDPAMTQLEDINDHLKKYLEK